MPVVSCFINFLKSRFRKKVNAVKKFISMQFGDHPKNSNLNKHFKIQHFMVVFSFLEKLIQNVGFNLNMLSMYFLRQMCYAMIVLHKISIEILQLIF
jgi:hypothetical protein